VVITCKWKFAMKESSLSGRVSGTEMLLRMDFSGVEESECEG
jgi:hypothetical protein